MKNKNHMMKLKKILLILIFSLTIKIKNKKYTISFTICIFFRIKNIFSSAILKLVNV